jgi:hypothetical protein
LRQRRRCNSHARTRDVRDAPARRHAPCAGRRRIAPALVLRACRCVGAKRVSSQECTNVAVGVPARTCGLLSGRLDRDAVLADVRAEPPLNFDGCEEQLRVRLPVPGQCRASASAGPVPVPVPGQCRASAGPVPVPVPGRCVQSSSDVCAQPQRSAAQRSAAQRSAVRPSACTSAPRRAASCNWTAARGAASANPIRGRAHSRHCIALHCIALHCIALHCIALHCIAGSVVPR